jgi:hypothetical protein
MSFVGFPLHNCASSEIVSKSKLATSATVYIIWCHLSLVIVAFGYPEICHSDPTLFLHSLRTYLAVTDESKLVQNRRNKFYAVNLSTSGRYFQPTTMMFRYCRPIALWQVLKHGRSEEIQLRKQ